MNQPTPTDGASAEPPAGPIAIPSSTSPPPRRSLRRWLLVLLLCIVLARLAGIQGWFIPVRIAGDSMAPILLGEHHRLACEECAAQFPISVADQRRSASERVICPNCGATLPERTEAGEQPGERVWIDHFAHSLRSLRRGELVALHDPLDPQRLAVKRVIGLPGETIHIEDGDIFVDAHRWQKSLDELREVAVLVHDDRHRPSRRAKPLPERWRDEHGWSVYHHWRCFASPLPRTDEFPVLDNDSFNQQLSRPLREVTDLLLVGRLTLARGEQVIVRLATPADWLAVILDGAANRIELRRTKTVGDGPESVRTWDLIESAPLPPAILDREVLCEVAVCDRRFLVAGEGKLWFTCGDGAEFQAAGTTPWAVACLGKNSRFVDRRILRDLYYLGPHDASPNWSAAHPLSRDEYLLLGDNSPVSIDSRHWPHSGAVAGSQIAGHVLRGRASR